MYALKTGFAILISLACYALLSGLSAMVIYIKDSLFFSIREDVLEFGSVAFGVIIGVYLARLICDKMFSAYSRASVFFAFVAVIVFSISVEMYFFDGDFEMVKRLAHIAILFFAATKVFLFDRNNTYI